MTEIRCLQLLPLAIRNGACNFFFAIPSLFHSNFIPHNPHKKPKDVEDKDELQQQTADAIILAISV